VSYLGMLKLQHLMIVVIVGEHIANKTKASKEQQFRIFFIHGKKVGTEKWSMGSREVEAGKGRQC